MAAQREHDARACQERCEPHGIDPAPAWVIISGMPPVAKPKRRLQRTFLREWRNFRGLTQEKASERLDVSRTLLSKIENAKSPYSQGLLEKAAEAYNCDPADLIVRNPLLPDLLWSITDNLRKATVSKQKEAVAIVEALLKTGT